MLPVNEWLALVKSQPNHPDLIEGVLADSNEYILLAGRTGIGKTNLVLQVAYSLATGTPFLGFNCQKVPVRYLGFEGSSPKMADRMEKIKMQFPDPGEHLRFHLSSPFLLLDKHKLTEFEALVRGCRVIIIDPLRYIAGPRYYRPDTAALFLGVLREELRKLGAAAIICHHIRKPNPQSLFDPGELYEIKGATEYVDSASSVLLLERARQGHGPAGRFAPVDPDAATLYFAKSRDAVGDLQPLNLKLNREKLIFEPIAFP